MSSVTERHSTVKRIRNQGDWKRASGSGIIGAVVMAAAILAMKTPTLAVAIPSLYGLTPPPNIGFGFIVHLSHGAVLGVLYAGIIAASDIQTRTRRIAAGVAWGVATWVGLAAIVMPVWLSVIGSPANPPFPNFAPPSLLWHFLYGVITAVVYDAVV